jgi:alkaline phosphatase D
VPEVDRRRFLAGLGAATGAGALRTLRIPAQTAPAEGPFAWGVASFDPTTTSVLIWTRIVPETGSEPVTVRFTVAEDPDLARPVATGTLSASAERDHTVTFEVADLPSGRTFHYAFETLDGARSTVGRTRTLDPDPDRLRLGVVSCGRYASAAFGVYRALADRDVDLVLHVGDYIYEDDLGGSRPHQPDHPCTTLADYRTRHRQHRADPDLQALHAAHPMVAVWDDHDVAANAWRGGASVHDDDRDGPWLDRLVAAGRARDEWVPGRTTNAPDGRLKAWRSLDLGHLAELVVLDTRHWGRDRQPTTAAELDDRARPRTMLGRDQAAFVSGRLERDDRPPWVFLANQVMLHPLRIPVPTDRLAAAVQRGGFILDGAHAVNPDQWDGYATAREDLLRSVGDRGGVVALTGDVHSSWAWQGPAMDGRKPTMVELVTPSATSETFADRVPAPSTIVEVGLRATEPDLSHVEISSHGYVLVDCTADRVQAEWWYVDPDDAATQRFATARTADREPPMFLDTVDEPTEDRAPGSSGTTSPRGSESDDGLPVPALGLGAAAAAAVVGGAVALRRRRR